MISDEQLLLYHYDDGLDANERMTVSNALAADHALRARLLSLVSELDAAAPIVVPVPRDVQQRWRTKLNALANINTSAHAHTNEDEQSSFARVMHLTRMATLQRRAGFAAAAITLVSIAIGITLLQTRDDTSESISTNVASTGKPIDDADIDRFERNLRWHLIETEQQLASFDQLNLEERAPMFEKLLVQNRLYVSAAERVGEPRYARALRGFAPVLERISLQETDATEVDAGLAQLHFELKIIQARLGANPKQIRFI